MMSLFWYALSILICILDGYLFTLISSFSLQTNRLLQTYPGMEQTSFPEPNLRTEIQPHFPQGEHPAIPNFQMRMPFLELAPSHLGKGYLFSDILAYIFTIYILNRVMLI